MSARASFVYGGVAFDAPADFVPVDDGSRARSHHARVRLSISTEATTHVGGPIRWTHDGVTARVETTGIVGTITSLGHDRFEARLTVSPSLPERAKGVAETVATTIAELSGGVVFHTAAIVHRQRAWLFVGPSGAGKSTAARLVPGAEELAADRASIVPARDGFDAFSLRLGTPSGLPLAAADRYPLAALLRVRHDGERVGVEALSPATALIVLRAAATTGGRDEHEPTLLARLDGLTRRVPVANVYTRLDTPLILPDFE